MISPRRSASLYNLPGAPTRGLSRGGLLLTLLIAAAVFIAFVPALKGEFLDFDDDVNFVNNTGYRGLGLAQLRWMFTTFHVGHYHPLTWLTLGLDYELWGMNPRGYHLTNNILHALNAAIFYLLVHRLLTWNRPAAATSKAASRHLNAVSSPWPPRLAAAFAALVFGLHPLRVESVAWITERRDLVSALLLLLTVLAYLRAHERVPSAAAAALARAALERRRWILMSLALFVASLLGKVIGMTLPIVLLALDWYPLRRFGSEAGDRRAWARRAARLALEKTPYFLLALIFGAIVAYFDHDRGWLVPLRDHSIPARIAQSFYGLAFYVWKTIWPLELLPLQQIINPLNWMEPRFIAAAMIVLAAAAAIWMARRRMPGLLAAAFCYAVLLGPTLGLVQTGPQLVADRYSYLSCMGWAVLAGAALLRLSRSQALAARPVLRHAVLPACAAILLVALGALTWRQCFVWRDSWSLWNHVIAHTDRSSFAYNARARHWLARGRPDLAELDLRSALALQPNYAIAYFNLGCVTEALNRVGDADAAYRKALRQDPALVEAHYNLGNLLYTRGDLPAAIAAFRTAANLRPDDARIRSNLGSALQAAGQPQQALIEFDRAAALDPQLVNARRGRAMALWDLGQRSEAIVQLRSIVATQPDERMSADLLRRFEAQMPQGMR